MLGPGSDSQGQLNRLTPSCPFGHHWPPRPRTEDCTLTGLTATTIYARPERVPGRAGRPRRLHAIRQVHYPGRRSRRFAALGKLASRPDTV